MPSILDPLTCGFAKVRCFFIFTCKSLKTVGDEPLLKTRHKEFNAAFGDMESFQVDALVFRRFKGIVKNIHKLGKEKKQEKSDIIDFFSQSNWDKLKVGQKKQHSLFNCPACTGNLLYKSKLAVFKNTARPFKKKAVKSQLEEAVSSVAAVKSIIENLDESFQSAGVKESFSSIAASILNIQKPKPTFIKEQKQQKKRREKVAKEFKREYETILAKRDVEW